MLTLCGYEICADERKESGVFDISGGKSVIRFTGGELTVSFASGRYDLSLAATGECFISSISLSGPMEKYESESAFLSSGFTSSDQCGAFGADEKQDPSAGADPFNPPSGKRGEHVSDMFFFHGRRGSGNGILAAQYPPFNQFVGFTFRYGRQHNDVTVRWDLERSFKRREEYRLDPLVVREGAIAELLPAYAAQLSSLMRIGQSAMPRTGWRTGNDSVSPERILSNIAAAKKRLIHFEFFLTDGGYAAAAGDWLTLTEPFKDRMAEISRTVRASGAMPGLRIAPFVISPKSPYFGKDGWVLRDRKGKPVRASFSWDGDHELYALDVTHPGVQDYVRSVISTLRRDWGMGLLVLDAMNAASLPGVRRDKTLTRAEVQKLGNSLIRSAAGRDMPLVCGGMPLSCAAGFADALLAGAASKHHGAVRGLFGGEKHPCPGSEISGALVRAFMDKHLWLQMPEGVSFRTGAQLRDALPMRSLRDLALSLGGVLAVSDDLTSYDEEDCAALRSSLVQFRFSARGRAVMTGPLERSPVAVLANRAGYISMFNLSDAPAGRVFSTETLDAAGFSTCSIVRNLGTGLFYNLTKPESVVLPPRGSAVFKIEG